MKEMTELRCGYYMDKKVDYSVEQISRFPSDSEIILISTLSLYRNMYETILKQGIIEEEDEFQVYYDGVRLPMEEFINMTDELDDIMNVKEMLKQTMENMLDKD